LDILPDKLVSISEESEGASEYHTGMVRTTCECLAQVGHFGVIANLGFPFLRNMSAFLLKLAQECLVSVAVAEKRVYECADVAGLHSEEELRMLVCLSIGRNSVHNSRNTKIAMYARKDPQHDSLTDCTLICPMEAYRKFFYQ
jgi:hypothetical protein